MPVFSEVLDSYRISEGVYLLGSLERGLAHFRQDTILSDIFGEELEEKEERIDEERRAAAAAAGSGLYASNERSTNR